MNKVIDLYYWPTPNGWKISIALEEMNLPHTTHFINIGAGDQFDPAFLKIAPDKRMPAITDPNGLDGAPVSIFESGAILLYLARKTGLFYGSTKREKIALVQWLMWQMGGVGPMAGQAHHFLKYASAMYPPHDLPYPKDRYRTEVARLYGVLDRQLEQNAYVAGDFYSIADMALWPWVSQWRGQQQTLADKPHLERWLSAVKSRDAVQRGRALAQDSRSNLQTDKNAQELLFKRNA